MTTAQAGLTEAEDAAAIVAENQAGSTAFLAAQTEQKALDDQVRQRQALRDRNAAVDKTLALARAEQEATADALEEIADCRKTGSALQADVDQQTALEAQRTQIEKQVTRLKTAGQEMERRAQEIQRQEKRQATLAEQLAQTDQLEAEREDDRQRRRRA